MVYGGLWNNTSGHDNHDEDQSGAGGNVSRSKVQYSIVLRRNVEYKYVDDLLYLGS